MPSLSRTSREHPYLYTALCGLSTLAALYLGAGAGGGAAGLALGGAALAFLCGLAVCLRPWRIRPRRLLDAVGTVALLVALAAALAAGGWVLAALLVVTLAVDATRFRTVMAVALPKDRK